MVISVGVLFFILLFLILNTNVDFDHELVNQLDEGVSQAVLMDEIENETRKEELIEKNHLKCHIMDMKYWGDYNCSPENDLKYDIMVYKTSMCRIKEKEELRKKFVRKEISKEQFLKDILIFKSFK